MSTFQAKWAIVKAENNGVITLKDKALLDSAQNINKRKYEKSIAFFGSIEDKLSNAKGRLSKSVQVLIITDAQFGKMNKTPDRDWWTAAMEVATTKQKSEIQIIK